MEAENNLLALAASLGTTSNKSESLYIGLISLCPPDSEDSFCQFQSIVRAKSHDHAVDQLKILVACGEYLPEEFLGYSLLRVDASIISNESLEYSILDQWFGEKWQADTQSFLND